MALKGDNIALYLSGQPVLIKDCNVFITQPKVKDIVLYGEEEFLVAVQLIGHCEKFTEPIRQGNPELAQYPDFNILMMLLSSADDASAVKSRRTVETFFSLIFPQYDVVIGNGAIEFKLKDDDSGAIVGMVTPFNFDSLKTAIVDLFESSSGKEKEIEYNPGNDAARKIAEKLKAGREKVKQIKSSKGGDAGSLFGTYISILSVGLAMDINTLYCYTPFQLFDTFTRYWAKVSSDFYQKVSTTPLMDTSKMDAPEEWSRNLYR